MIFVTDKGRMCNNILQYGHVYAWGREHGIKTVSIRFAYKYRFFHICHTRYHNFLVYVLAKWAAKCGLIPIVNFHEIFSDTVAMEHVMANSTFCLVKGWWVPWHDLFLKYKQEIVRLFAFDDVVRQPIDAKLSQLPSADLRLGVHIRRGDYRTWHDGKYYYSDEQYISYIRQFLALHRDKKVNIFICGNDPELNTSFFRDQLSDAHLEFPEGNAGEDLYLLSQCDYLIGAPSTYTLVASMYRDIPLCWILDADKPLEEDSFGHFDYLFQHTL